MDGPAVGRGGTFPTLICGDIVIKFFGHLPFWRRAHDAELAAIRCTARDRDVLTPNLLFNRRLFEDSATPWPYVVMTRIPGAPWNEAAMSADEKSAVAADVFHKLPRLLPLEDIATLDELAEAVFGL